MITYYEIDAATAQKIMLYAVKNGEIVELLPSYRIDNIIFMHDGSAWSYDQLYLTKLGAEEEIVLCQKRSVLSTYEALVCRALELRKKVQCDEDIIQKLLFPSDA